MSNKQEVKVTGNAFKYGYKVGDVVEFDGHAKWVVAEDGIAYSTEKKWGLKFNTSKSRYTLVTPAKESSVNQYHTTITTTISLEQGQVESLLIKTLGLEGKGVIVEWNQDGSVEVSYVSKE